LTEEGRPSGPLGKVPRDFLERFVFPNLGARRRTLLVRPGHGLDNAVVSLGRKKVLLVTCDPLSVIPSVGLEDSAWLSVHLIASDMTTSGVRPQYATFDLNLPPEMGLDDVGEYMGAIGNECKRLGIAIAGGHTGRYPGSGYTVVGAGTMFGVADRDSYVTPAMARPGDLVVITKGAAIGATAVLAHSFPQTILGGAGAAVLKKARSRLRDCSTVKEAEVAASLGLRHSVTSMHDATEGGVLGGLLELSLACGLPVLARRRSVHVPKEAAAVCGMFGLDPLTSTSEGTLIITCRPRAAPGLKAALWRKKIDSYEVGTLGERGSGEGLWLSEDGSKPRPHSPGEDGYWRAYFEAVAKGLS
jgi:hydrogenase expression/formation protein HypE